MKKSIKTAIVGVLLVPMLALGSAMFTPASSVYAVVDCANGTTVQDGVDCVSGADVKPLFGADGIFTLIINTALFVIGALSVLMLIYGGIRYTISMGDAKNVEAAKNTIMYAIIGIVIALLASAIVNFVLGALITTA
jgi:hypothetical protein